MSQTIRDVVIRIAVEQRDAKLKAPDVSAWESSIKNLENRLNSLGQTAATVQAKTRVGRTKEVISEEVAGEQAATKARLAMIDQIRTEDNAATAQTIANHQKTALSYKSVSQQAQEQLRSARMQTVDAFGALSGSIAQLARGSAFLFASTDDDMRKYLETLAKYQGVFDLIAGGAGTIKNAITLWSSLAAAQQASALAAGQAAAANAAGAASAGSSAAGSAAGTAAGRVAGSVASRVALPVAVASTLAYVGYEGYQESFIRPHEERQRRVEEARRERQRLAQEGNDSRFQSLRDLSGRTDLNAALYNTGQLTNSEAMEQARTNQNTARFQYQAAAPDNMAGPVYIDDAKRMIEFSEQSIKNYQQLVDLANQQSQALQSQASAYSNIADASRKQLEAEQKRYETLEESIGRLSAADAARLKRLAEAQKEGKDLSLEDAAFLESTGVGRNAASKRFRQEADARGAGSILEAFGERTNLDNLEATDASTQSTATQEIESLTKEIDKLTQQRQDDLKKLGEAIKANVASRSELEQLQRELEKFNQDQKRKSAMGR